MPSSDPYKINETLELIFLTQPKSLLDIGPGFGKFGFLAREYLDVADGREKFDDWKTRIDAIEAFAGYVTPLMKKIYDHVYVGDAVKVLPKLKTKYDLIIMIDLIEHLEYEEGRGLLKVCQAKGKNMLIVTPKDIGVQGAAYGNQYETHKFQWEKKHFRNLGAHFFLKNPDYLIAYIGPKAPNVKLASRHVHAKKLYIRRKLPFLVRPYKAAKRLIGR